MSGAIHELLKEVRKIDGVIGAAVLTAEGMCAASDLDSRFDEAAIAGLTSFLMSTTNRSLQDMTEHKCTRFTIQATHGKVVIDACGDEVNLVVITDQFTDLTGIEHELTDAVNQLRRLARMSV